MDVFAPWMGDFDVRYLLGLALLLTAPGSLLAEGPPFPHPLPPPHGSLVLPLAPPSMGLPPGSSVPLPGPLPPGVRVVLVPPGFYRPDPYQHYQYKAIDSNGVWRPRIIRAEGEFFYAIDGRPYWYYPSSREVYVRPSQ
jgi:hypothetical protein